MIDGPLGAFAHPELLLLLGPILWLAWRQGGPRPVVALRALAALALALAAADPRVGASGRDIVVIVDRSASMPADVDRQALEWIRHLEEARGPGDRIAVLSIDTQPRLIQPLTAEGRFPGFDGPPGGDASPIGAALSRALAALPADRAGAVALLSDGIATDAPAVTDLAARGVPVHARHAARAREDLLRVRTLSAPATASTGEPIPLEARIDASAPIRAPYRLLRDGQPIRSGTLDLPAGPSRVVWRDLVDTAGIHTWALEVDSGDAVPEDDRALAPVRVDGPRGALLLRQGGADGVNPDGKARGPSALAAMLSQAGMTVTVAPPSAASLDPLRLDGYRLVILEDVPAASLGAGLRPLADFVKERGGGLLMTGGPSSFAVGGYLHTPIEDILPVQLQLKQKQRNGGLCLVVALDRSGSMSMEVEPGVQKMDLANAGTAAAVGLLSAMDSVAVYAVDTEAWEILPLTPVNDPTALQGKIRQITSQGGGIYTNVAVRVAADTLTRCAQPRRHLVLFADAADAEAPEGAVDLAAALAREGITTSIIALGTTSDSDAAFLQDLAKAGQGQAFFSTDARELPQLFALDTMLSTDSAFVRDPTDTAPQAGTFMLGGLRLSSGPRVSGYNRSHPRPGATLGLLTAPAPDPDPDAPPPEPEPILAWGPAGSGRVGALLAPVGGTYGAGTLAWPDSARALTTLARWLGKGARSDGWYGDLRREGSRARLTVEGPPGESGATARLQAPGGRWQDVPLTRTASGAWEAEIPLDAAGVYLGMLNTPGGALALPPLALPASPEFVDLDPAAGRRRLQAIAQATGGSLDGPTEAPLSGPATLRGRSLRRPLAALALALLLAEIATRRLHLSFGRSAWFEAIQAALIGAWRRMPKPANAKPPHATSDAPPAPATTASQPAEKPAPEKPAPEKPAPEKPAPEKPPTDALSEALKKAKENADSRLRR